MNTLLLAALAIGMGDVKAQAQRTQQTIQPTFSDVYFAEVDKANTLFDQYMKTSCTDADYTDVDTAMHAEYNKFKSLAKNIEDQEKDPIKQDHEYETFVGFNTLLTQSVQQHRQCEADQKPNPNNGNSKN
jgi:chromosome condensin MukBEF complex kleisin-like MukF subunit